MQMKGLWMPDGSFRSFAEVGRDKMFTEIALRENSPYYYTNMFHYLPDPDPVLRKQGKDISVYREILSDAHLSSVIEQRKSNVLKLNWEIDRGKAKSREAKVITSLFKKMNMHNIINEILDSVLFGFQTFEITWAYDGSLTLPSKIEGKPQEWFCFGNNNEHRFKTKENPFSGISLSEYNYKFPVAQHKPTYANPYGDRVLSRCFWPIVFKKGGMKFWLTFVEKYGIPWVIGKLPRATNPRDADKLLNDLDAMVQDGVAVIPDDSSVDIKEPAGKGASADIFKGLAEFCNTEISKAVLNETLTTELQNKGSFSASKTHQGVADSLSLADRQIVTGFINTIIGWINEINFGSSEQPEFIMYEEEDVDLDLATRDKVLKDTGVKFTKSYFKRMYGFEDDEFDIVETSPVNQIPIPPLNNFSEAEDAKIMSESGSNLPGRLLQLQMEQILKPVFDLVNKSSDYNEIINGLSELYPKMNTSQLQQLIEKAIFISEIYGRINAGK